MIIDLKLAETGQVAAKPKPEHFIQVRGLSSFLSSHYKRHHRHYHCHHHHYIHHSCYQWHPHSFSCNQAQTAVKTRFFLSIFIQKYFIPAGVPFALWPTSHQRIDCSSEKGEEHHHHCQSTHLNTKPVQIESELWPIWTLQLQCLFWPFSVSTAYNGRLCFANTATMIWLPWQKVRSQVSKRNDS